jgi:hypothetical protein
VIAACGDDDDAPSPTPAVTTAAPTATSDVSGSPSPSPSATDEPFEGARDPVEKDAPAVPPAAIQTATRYAEHTTFDRFVFDFSENAPGYRVEYVEPPILADGSGNEVEIEGEAFLQVRFLGAQAHDEAGNQTIDEVEIMPGFETVVELESTGDFEGQVTWVFGLTEELDFRVIDLEDPTRVVIDIGHP